MTISNNQRHQQIREEIADKILESYLPSLHEGIERVILSSKKQIKEGDDIGGVIYRLEHLIAHLMDYDANSNVDYGKLNKNYDQAEVELRQMLAARRKEFKRGERAFRVLEKKYGIPAKTFQRAEHVECSLPYAKTLQVVGVYFKDEPERYNQAIELIDYLNKTYPKKTGKPYHPKELEERTIQP